jgi:Domain of unknown function (DUF3846)
MSTAEPSRHSATMKAGPTGLVIPVRGAVEEVILTDGLEQMQELVAGLIQALPIPEFIDPSGRSTAYVNEEGKMIGLEPNMRATDFMVPGVGLFWGTSSPATSCSSALIPDAASTRPICLSRLLTASG